MTIYELKILPNVNVGMFTLHVYLKHTQNLYQLLARNRSELEILLTLFWAPAIVFVLVEVRVYRRSIHGSS